MEPVDAVASIGELVSWFCLLPGIPALLVGLALRARDGRWLPVRIITVAAEGRTLARWYVGGAFHQRRLSRNERMRLSGPGEHMARVSEREPARMRLEGHPPVQQLLLIIGGILTAVGVLGFALSMLPLLGL